MADLLCTILIFCQGVRSDGKPFWAYMNVKPSMAKSFKEAREKGDFQLEDYGTVLAYGETADVPADVRDRMSREYGASASYEEELLSLLNSKYSKG